MPKFTPSLEEIKAMVECYAEKGTYSAVAREFNISPAIATRIIKENKNIQFAPENDTYTGLRPLDYPDFNEVVRFYNPTQDWRDSYAAKI